MFAIVAAKMAKAPYIRTAIETCKMGGFGLLVPFMFVYNPDLILEFRGPLEAVTSIVAGIVLVISAQVFFIGYMMTRMTWAIRWLFGLIGVGCFAFLPTMDYVLFVCSVASFILLVLYQRQRSMRVKGHLDG